VFEAQFAANRDCTSVSTVVLFYGPVSTTERGNASRSVSNGRSRPARRIVRWLVFLFAIGFIIDAFVGDRGLLATRRAEERYDANATALEQLRAENARLRQEVDRLNNDPGAIEEIARGQLGLMRPGEKVFIVKDLDTPPAR
jgi:cell division protein FtsB